MWLFFPRYEQNPFSGTTDSLAAPGHSQAVGQTLSKTGGCGFRRCRCLSACGTLDRTASHRFLWNVAFPSPGTHGGDRLRSRNAPFPGHLPNSASSLLLAFLPTAPAVPQPFWGARLWPVAAQSRNRDRVLVWASLSWGLARAGGCPGRSRVMWRAAELPAVTGLRRRRLAPEGRPRAGRGSAAHREAPGLGSALGKEQPWPSPAAPGRAKQQPPPGIWLAAAASLRGEAEGMPQWAATQVRREENPRVSRRAGAEDGRPVVGPGETRWGRGSGA